MAPARQPFSTLSASFRDHPQDRVSKTAVSSAGGRRPVFTNWTDGTGGANDLPGIRMSDLVGKEPESNSNIAALCVGDIVAGCLVFRSAMLAPSGCQLRAILE